MYRPPAIGWFSIERKECHFQTELPADDLWPVASACVAGHIRRLTIFSKDARGGERGTLCRGSISCVRFETAEDDDAG